MNRRYCNGMVHVIKPGDTLYQISRYYRIPMAMLLRANPYVDVYNLQVGQEICIPMVRAHRGMICMPVPKDEPLPVTAVADETETETQKQSETKKQTETNKQTPTSGTTPRTGDTTPLAGYAVVCVLSLAAALLLGGRKKFRR